MVIEQNKTQNTPKNKEKQKQNNIRKPSQVTQRAAKTCFHNLKNLQAL